MVLEEEFADYKSRRRVVRRPKSEIDTYLEEDPAEDSKRFDVLGWWKARADQFPVLSKMARDFLAIPLSTVSSESAFSCGNRILGDTRGSLTPQMLEALVSAKDWLTIVQDKDKDKDDEGILSGAVGVGAGQNMPHFVSMLHSQSLLSFRRYSAWINPIRHRMLLSSLVLVLSRDSQACHHLGRLHLQTYNHSSSLAATLNWGTRLRIKASTPFQSGISCDV
ncbi:uncharacterized protein LOC120648601 isoform X2 [Panicum virgatum]|uniref:uncharacterized protein LOC120648601 isoform X2 n=1 Tax=Panicum virgatum TaxID=38727 RepID=UPI0019D6A67B|nr:uncharacterized protein LOC120648601 isoform X2 [Panicum virgatum]